MWLKRKLKAAFPQDAQKIKALFQHKVEVFDDYELLDSDDKSIDDNRIRGKHQFCGQRFGYS